MIRRLAVGGGIVVLADHPARGGGGTPALLLHGFTGDRTSVADLAAALAADRRVVVPDLPGHGETEVGDDPARCTFAAAEELLRGVLRRLEVPRCALVGYSMGGRLALHLALAWPDVVERLVLVSASAGLPSAEARAARRRDDDELARFVERRPIADFVARWEALPLFATERALPAVVQAARRRQRLGCRPVGLAASLRGMGAGAQPWLGDRVGELAMPVALVAGARDPAYVARAGALATGIRGAALHVVADAGHAVHLERPAALVAIVRAFLGAAPGEDHACRSSG